MGPKIAKDLRPVNRLLAKIFIFSIRLFQYAGLMNEQPRAVNEDLLMIFNQGIMQAFLKMKNAAYGETLMPYRLIKRFSFY